MRVALCPTPELSDGAASVAGAIGKLTMTDPLKNMKGFGDALDLLRTCLGDFIRDAGEWRARQIKALLDLEAPKA